MFLAPGLLAAQAMNTATFESTYPVMAGIRWLKTYVAMVLTPLIRGTWPPGSSSGWASASAFGRSSSSR